ncbi:MAG: flavin reductase family protein [Rhodospirillales bacterium]|nr:flavin reductase family protein [Rhodospirillales bacterium]MCW8862252.1 flavin reductase family protein [Rhodospirillales bacterium]MCW8953217.1 flavin reductase family protein [Rhodospirillales bacterium]MCW9001690.1 flavin reductase family protein [Rhodospirillales bacterium]MCW9038866.1 flavin reductase family protein [Rhodospirillales bacterium]
MFYETKDDHGLPRDPFKACIVPRPIAWVSTVSAEGVRNLAPFSFFNGVAHPPPMVILSFNGKQPQGNDKDTLANIEQTGEFVVNVVSEALTDPMNVSCAPVAPEVDEFTLAGLETEPSRLIAPPRVKASPIAMECTLHQVVELPVAGPGTRNALIIGNVVGIHIDESVLTGGLVDVAKLRPLARLGYMDYTVVRDSFTLLRPKE